MAQWHVHPSVVIVDLDGTILDVSRRYYILYRSLLRSSGMRFLRKSVYWELKRNDVPEREIAEKTCADSFFVDSYLRARNAMIEQRRFLRLDKLMGRARSTLRDLQKRHRLYLVTMRRNERNLVWQLKALGLKQYFCAAFLCDEPSKSPIAMKRKAIEAIAREEVRAPDSSFLMVGDTEVDIIAGKEARILTCGVLSGIRSRKLLLRYRPDYIRATIADLRGI